MKLGLGSWTLISGFSHTQNRSDSIQTLHAALRAGIRHFDTAQSYDNGLSEQLVGHQLRRFRKEIDRDSYTIATKIFIPPSEHSVEKLLKLSLRRLCVDYIDILYLHWPSTKRDVEPILIELDRCRERGLINSIGLSNFPSHLLSQALEITPIEYLQLPHSLMWRRSLDSLLSLIRKHSLKTVSYSPLFSGLLSGKYRNREDLAPNDLRRELFPFTKEYHVHYLSLLDGVEKIAKECELPMRSVALAWLFSQDIDIVLTGSRTKEQLYQTIEASQITLSEADITTLTALSHQFDQSIERCEDNPFFHRY